MKPARCLAKRYRDEYVCTACNYTWNVSETAPTCRPKHYGEEKLREIRKVLDTTVVQRSDDDTCRTHVGDR